MRPCRCTRSRTRRRRCLSRSSGPGRGLGVAGARGLGERIPVLCDSEDRRLSPPRPNLEHKLKLLELELPGDPSYFPDRLVVRGRRSRFLGLRRRRRLLVVGSCGVSSCSSSAVRPDCTFEMARFRLLTAIEELC